MKTFVSGKIHLARITGGNPEYSGSILICPELLAESGIEPYERVEIYGIDRQARIATYVLPGAQPREITLNGGAANYFEAGDRVVIAAYSLMSKFEGANCIIVSEQNEIIERIRYEAAPPSPVVAPPL